MSYITLEDLEKRVGAQKLIELTNDDVDATEPSPDVVAEAIDYACGTFDSYARVRYTLPVPTTPLVKTRCLDLAVYALFRRQATFDEGVFKVKKTAHDEAIAFLKDIQAGRAALDIPAIQETIENPASPDRILTNATKSKFTDRKLSGF